MEIKQGITSSLTTLFENWSGEKVLSILPLAPSGSDRKYFRIKGIQKVAVGAYNADTKENKAFIGFSRHFKMKGIAVPEIYAERLKDGIYLQEDLGDQSLYHLLPEKGAPFTNELITLYKKVVTEIPRIQIEGGEGLDYNLCYPRSAFDLQSMLWDLQYFKYYFLKLCKTPFDEQALEEDFLTFSNYLLQADVSHFMYRDFQSRNIMLQDGNPYFIDYQGGRKGALQYDLASLLYQAKANIPHAIREELLQTYLEALSNYKRVDRKQFIVHYYGYVLIRTLQVLGAYGLRGLYERKPHFRASIPFAIGNLEWLLAHTQLPIHIPELKRVLELLVKENPFKAFDKNQSDDAPLTVRISSFSYKRGIPEDDSGNGGGFVFDCRGLNNPGRYEPYKKKTGRDPEVINFLLQNSRINDFLNDVYAIVDPVVENYLGRNFSNLMISFGCTGGQHRSVFSADHLAKHLQEKYGIKTSIHHIEQELKNWKN